MKNLTSIVLIVLMCLFASKINAQEITIFSGLWGDEYYQDDKKINKKQLSSLLEKNQEVYSLWNKSNTFKTLAWVSLAVETGFGIWTLDKLIKDENGVGPGIATLVSATSSLIFAIISSKKTKEAILKYNKSLHPKTTFKIEPSRKGLGIVLRF